MERDRFREEDETDTHKNRSKNLNDAVRKSAETLLISAPFSLEMAICPLKFDEGCSALTGPDGSPLISSTVLYHDVQSSSSATVHPGKSILPSFQSRWQLMLMLSISINVTGTARWFVSLNGRN